MVKENKHTESAEEMEFVRSVIRLLRLMHAYETGQISRSECWEEVLQHLTPEDAKQIPCFTATYHGREGG
ncbi:MAG: hypothetical protein ACRBCK_12450 [Alphaproteobacteria bacterium]